MSEHTPTPWMWAWRDDKTAPASIFSTVIEGHAYAVAMCPRYQKPEQWVADAAFIVKAVNSHDALVKALNDIINGGSNEPYQIARAALAAIKETV